MKYYNNCKRRVRNDSSFEYNDDGEHLDHEEVEYLCDYYNPEIIYYGFSREEWDDFHALDVYLRYTGF